MSEETQIPQTVGEPATDNQPLGPREEPTPEHASPMPLKAENQPLGPGGR